LNDNSRVTKPHQDHTSRTYWWRTNVVSLLPSNSATLERVELVHRGVTSFLDEFDLKFHVKEREQLSRVEKLVRQSSQNEIMDFFVCSKFLEKQRKRGLFRGALVILVDPHLIKRFADTDPTVISFTSSEPALWGISEYAKGLMLLRKFDERVTRHECAHLFGLAEHCSADPNCCMNWGCPTEKFCVHCVRKIEKLTG